MEGQTVARRGRPPKVEQVLAESEAETSVVEAEDYSKYHGFIQIRVPSLGPNEDDPDVDNGGASGGGRTWIPRNTPVRVPCWQIVPFVESFLPRVESVDRFPGVPDNQIPVGETRTEKKVIDDVPTYPGIALQMPTREQVALCLQKYGKQDGKQAKYLYGYFEKLGYLSPGWEALLG